MKFTIETKPLKAALTSLGKVVPAKSPFIAVLHVKIMTSDNAIILTGTDLDTVQEYSLPATILTEGGCCLNFAMLNAFIGAAKGTEVSIELANGQATIRSGKARIVLSALPEEHFPTYRPAEGELVGVDPKTIADAMRFCVAAASTKDTQRYLCGVGIVESNAGVCMWGTNGHIMHRAAIADLPTIGGGGIVPSEAVATIAAMADKAEAVQAMISPRGWHVRVGQARAWGKVIDAPYPDCERVIASFSGETVAFLSAERADLSSALNVAICGAESANKARSLVILAEEGKPAILRGARGADGVISAGRAETEAVATADARTAISAQYLATSLGALPAAVERVAVVSGSAQAPSIFLRPAQQSGVLDLSALIMGMHAPEAELADA